MQIARSLCILPIRLYKYLVSPLLPPACRFIPTCSEYAVEAIATHGILRGGLLAIGRLLRCHPFGDSGYDPVPRNPHQQQNRNGIDCRGLNSGE